MMSKPKPPYYCVGKACVPNNEECLALDSLGVEKNELRSAYLLDNRRIRDADGLVEGCIYEFALNAKIRAQSPFVLCGNRLFGHILVAQVIDPSSIDESACRKKIQQLADQIRITSDKPYSLVQNMTSRLIKDAAAWTPHLGSHGHFIGLYKEENDRSLANYYLVCHTDGGEVGSELVEKFVKPRLGQITYGDLVQSDEYKRSALYSYRNAQRLLAMISQTLGLRILKEDDLYAHVDPSRFQAPPDLGIPNVSSVQYNMLNIYYRPAHGNSVVFYSRSTNLCQVGGHAVAFLVDPCFGIILYKSDPNRNRCLSGLWNNPAANSFPIGTGRLAKIEEVLANKRKTQRDRNLETFTNTVVSWSGRASSVPPASHEKIYSYADYSEERKTIHSDQLGARYGSTRLKPVLLVIAPPE